nr:hypothetical protein [Tanacetum cinerariifolium]
MAPVTPPLVPAGQPMSVYEVRGPSTMVVEGPSFPHLAPGLSVPPFMIEDLSTRLSNLEDSEAEMVSPEVESEKWRRPLLRWMYVAFDVSTDGREENSFPRNGM